MSSRFQIVCEELDTLTTREMPSMKNKDLKSMLQNVRKGVKRLKKRDVGIRTD